MGLPARLGSPVHYESTKSLTPIFCGLASRDRHSRNISSIIHDDDCAVQLSLANGVVGASPSAQVFLGRFVQPDQWPFKPASIMAVGCLLHQKHEGMWLALMQSLAWELELVIQDVAFKDKTKLLALACAGSGNLLDPDLRVVYDSLGRNAYATCKVLRKTLRRLPAHRP